MKPKIRIAIMASGRGTNAEAIITYFKDDPGVKVVRVLSNNEQAGVVEKAIRHHIPATIFTRDQWNYGEVQSLLQHDEVTHIVLAGFLWLIPQNLIQAFPNRIINIHPSLLPRFGGKGMYGMKVHEAVKASGEGVTGITIHLVNEHFDEGKIIFQERCRLEPTDSVDQIAAKVSALELKHYPEIIRSWVSADAKRI